MSKTTKQLSKRDTGKSKKRSANQPLRAARVETRRATPRKPGVAVDDTAADVSAPKRSPARTPRELGRKPSRSAGITAFELSTTPAEQIAQLVAGSEIARYRWLDRGIAKPGYLKGIALVFARVIGRLRSGQRDAVEMAAAVNGNLDDALVWYSAEFNRAGMSNTVSGLDTLRHLFVLLTGLGMRESSGRYCEGHDRSASNTTAATAEAGLFQASYNACAASPELMSIFQRYLNNPSGFIAYFREGVSGAPSDWENFGSGDGAKFQRLSKECPAFAVEFAALGIRKLRRAWEPLNRREAELRSECDRMLFDVQQLVDRSPQFDSVLSGVS